MKRLIPLVLSLALAGCSPEVDVSALERDALTAYNADLAKDNIAVRSTKVSLVHESGNKYTGFADLSDGTRINMEVTYDGNKLIYKTQY